MIARPLVRSLVKPLARGSVLTSGGALDADARAYIAAVEAVLPGNSIETALPNASNPKRIISDFIKSEKAASRWALHKRIYLPIYNNAAANAIDAVSMTSGTFFGTVTHAAGYFQGDGASGYFDTIANWDTLVALTDATIGTINFSGNGVPNMTTIGVGATVATAIRVASQNSGTIPQCAWAGAGIVRAVIGTNGIQMASRSGGVTRIIRRSSAGITEDSTSNPITGSVISFPLTIGANNSGAVRVGFSDAQIGGGIISLGMSSAQLANYSLALKNLYESLTGLTLP